MLSGFSRKELATALDVLLLLQDQVDVVKDAIHILDIDTKSRIKADAQEQPTPKETQTLYEKVCPKCGLPVEVTKLPPCQCPPSKKDCKALLACSNDQCSYYEII